jgi:hypothetical protein
MLEALFSWRQVELLSYLRVYPISLAVVVCGLA